VIKSLKRSPRGRIATDWIAPVGEGSSSAPIVPGGQTYQLIYGNPPTQTTPGVPPTINEATVLRIQGHMLFQPIWSVPLLFSGVLSVNPTVGFYKAIWDNGITGAFKWSAQSPLSNSLDQSRRNWLHPIIRRFFAAWSTPATTAGSSSTISIYSDASKWLQTFDFSFNIRLQDGEALMMVVANETAAISNLAYTPMFRTLISRVA